MKFDFDLDLSNKPYNLKLSSIYIFAISLLILIVRMYSSIDYYKSNLPLEVHVHYKNNVKSVEKDIVNGKLVTSPYTVYNIKSKNYLQYFILEFDPSSKDPISLFFCFNFFVIASIFAFFARKSTIDKIFTRHLSIGLNVLRAYIIVMMVSKLALIYYFKDFIAQISNHQAIYRNTSHGEFFSYQVSLVLVALFITFVKRGLQLQQEQDLTV
jgi:hypothetical protein